MNLEELVNIGYFIVGISFGYTLGFLCECISNAKRLSKRGD